MYDSAPEESRTPMVMVPEDLTLAMVSLDWANTPLAKVMANPSNCFFMVGSG